MAPHMQDALKSLDELEADLIREQRAAAMPKPHQFDLRIE
jgi:hypothetical protein